MNSKKYRRRHSDSALKFDSTQVLSRVLRTEAQNQEETKIARALSLQEHKSSYLERKDMSPKLILQKVFLGRNLPYFAVIIPS